MAAAAVLALWWAGPPGLETDPFVQDLTARSVVIARIDRILKERHGLEDAAE